VVKGKLSSFGVKRTRHRAGPQPALPSAEAVIIVGPSKPVPIRRRSMRRRRVPSRDGSPTTSEPAKQT